MKFKINNLEWEALLAKQDNVPLKEEYSPCGITSRSRLKVYLNVNLPDDLMRRTIIHELTHAYFWSYGLTQIETIGEENVCDFIETHGRAILDLADRVYEGIKKETKKPINVNFKGFNEEKGKLK